METVEARDPDTHAFFKGSIVDFQNGKLLVQFSNGWKNEWLEPEYVRAVCAAIPAGFQPQPGEAVEVLAQSVKDGPYGWWEARVKSVKGEYALVQFVGWDDTYDDIVERELIRPKNMSGGIVMSSLNRVEIPLPKELKGVAAAEHFKDLQKESGVCLLRVDVPKNCVVILGTPTQCRKAEMLAHLNFTHIAEIAKIRQRNHTLQSKLQESKKQVQECAVEIFSVDPSVVGLVIGKKGKHIRKAKELVGVESVKVDHETGQVRILAKTPEIAAEARRLLEFCVERIPLEDQMVGWVIGRKGRYIREIEERSGCIRMTVERSRSDDGTEQTSLNLVGTKEAVENARLLVTMHIGYMGQYEEAENEQRHLNQEMHRFSAETGIAPMTGDRLHGQGTRGTPRGPSSQYNPPRWKRTTDRENVGDNPNAGLGAQQERQEKNADESETTSVKASRNGKKKSRRRNAQKAKKDAAANDATDPSPVSATESQVQVEGLPAALPQRKAHGTVRRRARLASIGKLPVEGEPELTSDGK